MTMELSLNTNSSSLKNNVYFIFAFISSRILGCFPFIVRAHQFQYSLAWSTYSCIFVLIVGGLQLNNLFTIPPVIANSPPMVQFFFQASRMTAITIFIILYDAYKTLPELNRFLKELRNINEAHKVIGIFVPEKFDRIQLQLDFLTVVSLIYPIVEACGVFSWRILPVLSGVAYAVGIWTQTLQFSAFALLLGSQFARCQEFLRDASQDSVRYAGRADKVVVLAMMHRRLCHCCDLLEGAYGRRIFCVITTAFLVVMYNVFSFLIALIESEAFSYKDLLNLYPTVFYTCIVFKLTLSCENMKNQAKDFNVTLYQLMINDKTKEFIGNKRLSLHIKKSREVVFTACEVFVVDNTLIHTMVASVATFLVILIQFGQDA